VGDYTGGKVDWLARGLPTEGEGAAERRAGEVARRDVATCALGERIWAIRPRIDASPYGFALVVSGDDIVLGRLRRSALDGDLDRTAEQLMEPGPSTVRAHEPLARLLRRLSEGDLTTAVVTTPEGRLIGVVHRERA
jgi:CBS domain-containing protein